MAIAPVKSEHNEGQTNIVGFLKTFVGKKKKVKNMTSLHGEKTVDCVTSFH